MTTTIVANEAAETPEDEELLRALAGHPYLVYQYFPGVYAPMKYSLGEVCEDCWMKYQVVYPNGKNGCDHG